MAAKLVRLVAASLLFVGLPTISANVSKTKTRHEIDLNNLSPRERAGGNFLQSVFKQVNKNLKTVKDPTPADLEDEASDMTSDDMEKAVEKLVLGARTNGGMVSTPMKYSIKTIKELLDSVMIPKIIKAHTTDQHEIDQMHSDVVQCGEAKRSGLSAALERKHTYEKASPTHKICRGLEAVFSTERTSCWKTLEDKKAIKKLKCAEFAAIAGKVGDENANVAIMKKGGSESVESYVTRITSTVCGGAMTAGGGQTTHPGPGVTDPNGGDPNDGFAPGLYQEFMKAKNICSKATNLVNDMHGECTETETKYFNKKKECDNVQDQMDDAACQRAVLVKDSCEAYSECYTSKVEAFETTVKVVKREEKDRKSEWTALKRMECYLNAFNDEKVEDVELDGCRALTFVAAHLEIVYPTIPERTTCTIPDLYPSTPEYKQKEFIPLPALSKGKVAAECVGVLEISTKPREGSPEGCVCDRVTMNGPYSPGPMVKCTGCLDVRRSKDKNSCPDGTKIFSPRSREDWKTLINSISPLRDPHWIIDITRPENGCGDVGCTAHAMNSKVKEQQSWMTSDGSPWWLRKFRYTEPNGDYHANCYLDLWHEPKDADHVEFNDGSCGYHSKSYYCQSVMISEIPKAGSPDSCKCEKVGLAGPFSAGALLRCSQCLDVRKSKEKNSCPEGTKIFSPASRADWETFLESAKPVRSPNFIVDVTRPTDGCGGCDKHAMNSKVASQATWITEDGSAWWLRSEMLHEPGPNYQADCYMDLTEPTPGTADVITFKTDSCFYHSNSYYCQPKKGRR